MALTESYVAGPATPAIREMTFGDLLRSAAEQAPDRIALISGLPDPAMRRKWTYLELYNEAQRTARALLTRFKPGERVAVWAQNIPEWIMLEFGAGLAGMVLVTVNPGFRANELEYVLKQSRSAGIFVVNSFRSNPMLDTVHEVAPRCPELREVICFDDWSTFIAAGDNKRIELPTVKPGGCRHDPVHLRDHWLSRKAHCCITAGWSTTAPIPPSGWDTTGRRVHHDHAAIPHRRLRLLCARRGVEDGDAGTGGGVRAGPRTRDCFGTYRGNAMMAVPTMLVAMLEHPAFASTDLSSVKAICSGGSTVPAALVTLFEQKLGAPFTIVFGQTECSPVAAMTR